MQQKRRKKFQILNFSVEEPEHFASDLLAPRLLVVHDPGARRQHDDAEEAGREQPRDLERGVF